LAVLGGIVALATGIKLAIANPETPIPAAAWFLALGVAMYILGLIVFRRVLGLGPIGLRLIIAVLAAATVIVGLAVSPLAELGALVAIVGGGALVESRSRSPGDSSDLVMED